MIGERTVALHNTGGVPWGALCGAADTLVFAFDADDTGREDAKERAIEAIRRGGFDAYTLHDEATYAGHGDPNEALEAWPRGYARTGPDSSPVGPVAALRGARS